MVALWGDWKSKTWHRETVKNAGVENVRLYSLDLSYLLFFAPCAYVPVGANGTPRCLICNLPYTAFIEPCVSTTSLKCETLARCHEAYFAASSYGTAASVTAADTTSLKFQVGAVGSGAWLSSLSVAAAAVVFTTVFLRLTFVETTAITSDVIQTGFSAQTRPLSIELPPFDQNSCRTINVPALSVLPFQRPLLPKRLMFFNCYNFLAR